MYDDTKDCPANPYLSKDCTQITKSFESLILPSAHLYPNVFWPPSQLSPSADGNALVARQYISTVATPKDVMQTRERIQTNTAMFLGRGSNILHIAGTITISISFFMRLSKTVQISYKLNTTVFQRVPRHFSRYPSFPSICPHRTPSSLPQVILLSSIILLVFPSF